MFSLAFSVDQPAFHTAGELLAPGVIAKYVDVGFRSWVGFTLSIQNFHYSGFAAPIWTEKPTLLTARRVLRAPDKPFSTSELCGYHQMLPVAPARVS